MHGVPVAAVLAAALFLVPGANAAAGAENLPESIELPMPAVGDKGVYTLTRVVLQDGEQKAGPAQTIERFAWLTPARKPNAEGTIIDIARVFEQAVSAEGHSTTLRDVDFFHGKIIGEAIIDLSEVDSSTYYNRTYYRFVDPVLTSGYSTQVPFCGLFLPGVQGAELRLHDELTLFNSACSLPAMDRVAPLAGVRFRAAEVEVVDGATVIAFTSLPDHRATVWFSPDYPYPLRISLERSTGVDQHYDVYRLERFDRGDGSVAGTARTPEAAREVQFAPREAWGPKPVAGGVFSLQEAYEAAMAEASSELQEFLSTHPEAYMSQASYGESLGGPIGRREWHFTMTDAREQLLVHVARHWPRADDNSSEPELIGEAVSGVQDTGEEANDPYTRVTYRTAPIDPEQAPPPLHLVPTEVPTVRSGIDAWRSMADANFAANQGVLWGFSISLERCENEGVPCDQAHVRMEVGTRQVVRTPAGPQTAASILVMDERGRIISLDETYIWPVPPPASREIPWSTTALVASDPVPGSHLDALPIALGATSIAALTLAIIFVWLKSGGLFALYARVLPSEEEGAIRKRLLDVIHSTPGIHRAEIVRAVGVPESTARYHLRRLKASGSIVSVRVNGLVAYHLQGSNSNAAVAAVLRSRGARAIVAVLTARPGANGRDISVASGLSPATVTYHLTRLSRAGVVSVEKSGREIHATLTGVGQEAWRQQAVLSPSTALAWGRA